MTDDDDLRAKMRAALREKWQTPIIDALMPVVREALASARANAWDQGAEATYEWQIGIMGKPDNPWRKL